MGYWAVAVTAVEISRLASLARNDSRRVARNDSVRYNFYAIVVAAVLVALEGINHLLNEIINVKKFHLNRTIIYLDREVVGDVVAEGCYCRVVVGTAPFTEEVRETVDQDLCSGFRAVFKHQLFSSLFALSVLACAETACEGCLD